MPKIIKRGRVATSSSNLADPRTPAHVLAARFQKYMYLPDPTPLYVTLGALAGNMLSGKPVWLMLVGSSSSGKTALLKSCLGIERTRAVAAIKGAAALLSGVKKKDQAKDATGGILRELGNCGCLVFTDFTSILSLPKDACNEILSALRQIYDRDWVRDIGGEGGRKLHYDGRVALLGGSTPAIDRNHAIGAEMGERVLFYRMPESDGYQAGMQAANDTDIDRTERERRDLVTDMFAGLGLSLETQRPRRLLTVWERDKIVNMAQFGSRARSGVPRDFMSKQIIDVPSIEVATRMVQELSQLYAGLEVIGVSEPERWEALKQVVIGSMPLARQRVVKIIEASQPSRTGRMVTKQMLAEEIPLGLPATGRVVEDLELLGVLEKDGASGWRLSGWSMQRLVQGEI